MVSRSELDLLDIRAEYKRMYGKSLYHDITVRDGANKAFSSSPHLQALPVSFPSLEQLLRLVTCKLVTRS